MLPKHLILLQRIVIPPAAFECHVTLLNEVWYILYMLCQWVLPITSEHLGARKALQTQFLCTMKLVKVTNIGVFHRGGNHVLPEEFRQPLLRHHGIFYSQSQVHIHLHFCLLWLPNTCALVVVYTGTLITFNLN